MKTIEQQIKVLEEKLLHTDARSNPQILNELLAEEFEEIGASGNIISKEEVIDWLVNKEHNICWSLENFRTRQIADNIILATYQATKENVNPSKSRTSMRSSIWKHDGHSWKIVFHQGTRIDN